MDDAALPADLAQALEETGAQAGWDSYSDALRADAPGAAFIQKSDSAFLRKRAAAASSAGSPSRSGSPAGRLRVGSGKDPRAGSPSEQRVAKEVELTQSRQQADRRKADERHRHRRREPEGAAAVSAGGGEEEGCRLLGGGRLQHAMREEHAVRSGNQLEREGEPPPRSGRLAAAASVAQPKLPRGGQRVRSEGGVGEDALQPAC